MADIFVSYTSKDREWAFWIGHELRRLGHEPHIHEWEIPGGGDILEWMHQRLAGANHVLCVVSDAYLVARYSGWELRVAQWAATSGQEGLLLPVFVEDCKPPIWLATIKRCDLFAIPEDEAQARLAAYLAEPGSAAPGPFPGKPTSASAPLAVDPFSFPGSKPPSSQPEAPFPLAPPSPGAAPLPPPVELPAAGAVSPPPLKGGRAKRPQIKDAVSFHDWLTEQGRDVAVAMAARAALRAAPLAVLATKNGPNDIRFLKMVSVVFRASALAWTSANYPKRAQELRAHSYPISSAIGEFEYEDRLGCGLLPLLAFFWLIVISAHEITNSSGRVSWLVYLGFALAVVCAVIGGAVLLEIRIDFAARGAIRAARSATKAAAADYANVAASAAIAAADAVTSAYPVPDKVWDEINFDVGVFWTSGVSRLSELPLWREGAPELAKDAWVRLRSALPKGEDWILWVDWYEERLRGGSRGEAWEMAFASVPERIWERGPAAANAWISQHLPEA